MDHQQIIEDLLDLLEASCIEIRRESMGGSGGGLCQIKDKPIFFVDLEASPMDTAQQCIEAVNSMVNIETVYLRPQVRQALEHESFF